MGYSFISYSSNNQQMTESFRSLFNQKETKTWMAPGDIPARSSYWYNNKKAESPTSAGRYP